MREFDYGYEYAKFYHSLDPDVPGPVDIERELTSTIDIPPDDYRAMRDAGIANPDAREYWQGYNAYFASIMKCHRCSHQWTPRTPKRPRVCPKCKSPYFDRPRR